MKFRRILAITLSLVLISCDETSETDSDINQTANESTGSGNDGDSRNDTSEYSDANFKESTESGANESAENRDGEIDITENRGDICSESKDCYGINRMCCDRVCVNPLKNERYCGAKDGCTDFITCAAGEECYLGVCKKIASVQEPSCKNGTIVCDNECVDPKNNKYYCGAKNGCIDYTTCTKNYHECMDGTCYVKIKSPQFYQYLLKYYDLNHDDKLSLEESNKIEELSFRDDLLCQMSDFEDLNRLSNLKKIGKHVFERCESVSEDSSTFHNYNIEELDDYSFYGTGLTKVWMENLTKVNTETDSEGMTFADSPNLDNVIMTKLTRTSVNMFKNCKKINCKNNRLYLSNLQWISRGTFAGCEGLTYYAGQPAGKVTRVDSDAFDGAGIKYALLQRVKKIGFDENDVEGTTFKNNPNLECLNLNHNGAMEVSMKFADKDVAAHTKLVLYYDKDPNSNTVHTSPMASGNEWPEGSGIIWKEIVFKHTEVCP